MKGEALLECWMLPQVCMIWHMASVSTENIVLSARPRTEVLATPTLMIEMKNALRCLLAVEPMLSCFYIEQGDLSHRAYPTPLSVACVILHVEMRAGRERWQLVKDAANERGRIVPSLVAVTQQFPIES
jgi:hypothetical protein